jgi:membrane protein YqaA with SNARE-associated domain
MVGIGIAFANGMDPTVLLQYGYPGISLIMFFSSATVLLPAPGFAAVLGAGSVINPWIVGPFAGLGSAVGELTGYMVGLGSREAIEARHGKWWNRTEAWMKRNGFITVLIFASFPNPFFDAIGVIAGSLGLQVSRVFLACLIGNSIKYTTLALLGSSALELLKFFE